MFQERSVQYEDRSLHAAIDFIKELKPGQGGAKFSEPLAELFKKSRSEEYYMLTKVILVLGGPIWD